VLDETEVLDDLVAGWKRIVEGHAPCYDELVATWRPLAAEQQRQLRASGYCESWARPLNICSVQEQSLVQHIRWFKSANIPPEKVRVLNEVFLGHRLGICMANILEQADPALAEQIQKLGSEIPGDSQTKRSLGERAWKVWREHGVERWLDETLAAGGTMPDGPAEQIEACNEGRVPERTSSE
jgi:hypothetical protein